MPRLNGSKSLLIGAFLLFLASCGLAHAQGVPVTDAKGLTKQLNISDCFQKIKSSNDQKVSPIQGITKSHTTAGQAGSAGQVGSRNISGTQTASTASTAPSSNIDLNAYTASAGTLGSLNSGTYSQGLNASSAAATALPSNTSTMQGIQGQVGTLDAEQQAFDQNSASRVSNAALWNQAIQTGSMGAQLRNQWLTNQVSGAAAVSNLMTFTIVPSGGAPVTTSGCKRIQWRFPNGATVVVNNCP